MAVALAPKRTGCILSGDLQTDHKDMAAEIGDSLPCALLMEIGARLSVVANSDPMEI